ncbi:MAG: DUF1593 domain-containing protein [Acidobacteria bacterium]|nr:DUF1593 domain-containing protein [Acidobacteriota bacterium]
MPDALQDQVRNGASSARLQAIFPLRLRAGWRVQLSCLTLCLGLFCAGPNSQTAQSTATSQENRKVRLIVLTDIGGDPDDEQSLVRLLVYANEFDIEGLIAGAHPYKDGSPDVRTDLIEERVRAYGEVRENLLRHKKGYPSMQYLLDRIKRGHPDALNTEHAKDDVWRSIGNGKDTEGSGWIISVVDKPDPRPVWFSIWGGPNELAQAIWKVSRTRTPEQLAAFKAKIRVHACGDQDNTGFWLEKYHPDIFWLRNGLENWQEHYDKQMIRGMYQLGDQSLMSTEWMNTHVRQNHGPLGALYPSKTWSPPNNAMKEGDTPTWFSLVPNGLGDPREPAWGGWGGRFVKGPVRYEDAEDTLWGITSERVCIARWRPHFQADFQARMDWCATTLYREANHEPVAKVDGLLRRKVAPGTVVNLSAAGSSDPDGNTLSYNWYFYKESSSYKGDLTINNADASQASFPAPKVDSAQAIHIILTVTDNGTPNLSRYKRVIVTVEAAAKK